MLRVGFDRAIDLDIITCWTEKTKCENCQKEAKLKCSKCSTAYYCDRNCQIKDWPEHKKNCFKQNEKGEQSNVEKTAKEVEENIDEGGIQGKCVYCDKKAKVQCEECNKVGKEVLYCSDECLNKDKERHKIFCGIGFKETPGK
uniref:MYND-type domain-containing protein n=1 Tax=Meloidogyne incognita TaxID=6306 RepID=A0A914LQE2_MELIC